MSRNDFYMFNHWFFCWAKDFYTQQEIYIFSNLKFVSRNMRFIFDNLRFAFNEMKLIQLRSFTFSKPYLDVTKYTIKSIRQNERSSCKLYIQSVSIFSHFSNVLCTLQRSCLREKFSVSFHYPNGQRTYAENWDGGGGLVTSLWKSARSFINTTMTCAYSFSWSLQ